MRHLINITDLSTAEIDDLTAVAEDMIADPEKYQSACRHKKLATLFFEPSTRTRLSFEAAMLDCSVAIIKNVNSSKQGRKDIIKIDEPIELDLEVLGYVDPNITVNVIRDGIRVEKKNLQLPERLRISSGARTPGASPPRSPSCPRSFCCATRKSGPTAVRTARTNITSKVDFTG